MTERPLISLIIIVYKMPRQALNTIYSFSTQHQKNIDASDYEIIVVENASGNDLAASAVESIGPNIRYFQRKETSQSPARAINFGLSQARGRFWGLLIDGARMATPRLMEYTRLACQFSPNILVSTPCYNLGPLQHQHHVDSGYNEDVEMALLEKCRWRENGYRLFDIASLGDANSSGLLNPALESNCFFSSAENFQAIGNADERFDLPGGGSLNIHMYRALGGIENIAYFVLPGEGTFHQFHGGVTTSQLPDRELLLEQHRKQLRNIWGGQFTIFKREPILLGSVTSHAQRYLMYSARRAWVRARHHAQHNQELWPDDESPFS